MTNEEYINFANCLKNNYTIDFDVLPEFCDMAISALKDRPKGEWIEKEGREEGYDIGGVKTWYVQIMCNKCGFIKTAIEGHTSQYNFCPNCGADMRPEPYGGDV